VEQKNDTQWDVRAKISTYLDSPEAAVSEPDKAVALDLVDLAETGKYNGFLKNVEKNLVKDYVAQG
jgi:hypothetical protein